MSEQHVGFNNSFAKWQGHSAFNVGWQYSYINRSTYYANISGEFKEYMQRFVQNYLWWYDGWVPYFHDKYQGMFATRLATALVNGTARKVVGGRLFFKTAKKETNLEKDEKGEYKINKALSFISSEWAIDSEFPKAVKQAITFSAAAGTSLLKIDKVNGELKVQALRQDSFYPVLVGDKLIQVECFLREYVDLKGESNVNSYVIVERRYYDDYTTLKGEVRHNQPMVEYIIKQANGSVTNGQDYSVNDGQRIQFKFLPKNIRSEIGKLFSHIQFDKPMPMGLIDIGCELVKWTDNVSALPELPFGESLLANIMPFLQSYDYYYSAFNTDMYLGRGRVLIPKPMQSKNAKDSNAYDSLSDLAYTQVTATGGTEPIKPTPIQFDLRAQSWNDIRTHIIQNIAINTGMNLATIASFLNDQNAAKTAREVSTEESETASFIDDKREILERPINRILKRITTYYGFSDTIVIRWSSAGLTNIYARTELISQALQNGFISKKKAIQMFNQDDDEYQLQDEYDAIKEEESSFDTNLQENYGGLMNDSEQAFKQSGFGDRDSGE